MNLRDVTYEPRKTRPDLRVTRKPSPWPVVMALALIVLAAVVGIVSCSAHTALH